eukprot:490491-Pelagomonas_calceolata.AAC.1
MRTSPSAPGKPLAGHPIHCLPWMAYIIPIIFSKRSRHLAYWRQISGSTHETQTVKNSLITTGVLSQPLAWQACTRYIFSLYSAQIFVLGFTEHIVRSVARFRLRVHTLKQRAGRMG